MRQAIRALGWATYILWIILIFFTVTAVYSAFQLGLAFGEPEVSVSGSILTASFPFSVANRGFYDISDLELSTQAQDNWGSIISNSSTFVQTIPRGDNVSVRHNMFIDISQLTTEDLSYLLFNDTVFDADMTLKLNYANAVPFKISSSFPMPWGAPLSNLTLGNVSITPDITNVKVTVPVSFENHSYFPLNGTIRIEITDNRGDLVGEGATNINAQPQSPYGTTVEVLVSGNPANIREARLYFETSVFSYGPVVIPLA